MSPLLCAQQEVAQVGATRRLALFQQILDRAKSTTIATNTGPPLQTPGEHVVLEEFQQLKAELANARSDVASAAALASEHKPIGLCGSAD
jgi:hypothetical protein